MLDVIIDMETQDPDDYFMLCFLAGHPNVNVRAVTANHGSDEQCGLIRHILNILLPDRSKLISIGSRIPNYKGKSCVSAFHHNLLGEWKPYVPDGRAADVINCERIVYPNLIIITGAALHNPYDALLELSSVPLSMWFGQGGFAGDNIAPVYCPRFKGMETVQTYNFNGGIPQALFMLKTDLIKKRYLVSKNVTHAVFYDKKLHAQVESHKNANPGIRMVYDGMDFYLDKCPTGKKFHDPLAACCLIDRDVCEFKEVELFVENKRFWGSRLKDGTNTFISVNINTDKFVETLCGIGY